MAATQPNDDEAARAANPWLRAPHPQPPSVDDPEEAGVVVTPASSLLRASSQPGIVLPSDRFPTRTVDSHVGVWWVGAHGGAGESTLEQLVDGSQAAGHAWPIDPHARPHVVVVARTHAHGLGAAQRVAAEWASGEIAVDLLGLVLIADAPGRLPRPLKDFVALLAGGLPTVWHIPWVEGWRTGDPVSIETAPRAVRQLVDDLRTLRPEPNR